MNLFQKDVNKPGKVILHVGIVVFVATLIILLVWQKSGGEFASRAIFTLLIFPIFLPLFMIMLLPAMFFHGIISGMPSVGFSYIFSKTKYYWRGIGGSILLVTTLTAFILNFI